MDENTDFSDDAYFDYLGAREAALQAAVGYFVTDNIPTHHLRLIVEHTRNEVIVLAANIALHQRGEWKPERGCVPRVSL